MEQSLCIHGVCITIQSHEMHNCIYYLILYTAVPVTHYQADFRMH